MSTPSPAGRISLPVGKRYQVTILNEEHFPPGHPGQLVFSEDKATKKSIARFSVPNLGLTELDSHVKVLEDGLYEFRFTLNNPTKEQQDAGYLKGAYIFRFAPPPTNPAQFGGTVNDPWPDQAEDIWTAEGRPPDPEQGGTYS